VNGAPDYRKDSPQGLTVDPEFLELNPNYQNYAFYTTPPDALVQLGGADVTSLLWSWVTSDPDARAFLSGTPDKVRHGDQSAEQEPPDAGVGVSPQ
jgi:hypothetical protein